MKLRELLIPLFLLVCVAFLLRYAVLPSPAATSLVELSLTPPAPKLAAFHPSPPRASMSAAELVRKLIAENVVMVFSKSWCPYCAKAKRILGAYSLKGYKVLELDQGQDEDGIQDVLKEMTGARSVPRVFIQGKCIGGGDDTERLEREGKLKQMLTEAGAL